MKLTLDVYHDVRQGGRQYMEDIISIVTNCDRSKSPSTRSEEPFACFYVFDGHGGVDAAKFAEKNLHKIITSQEGFYSSVDSDVLKAIRNGFLTTHKLMWNVLDTWPRTHMGNQSTSGTTASMVLVRSGKMYVAHVGDSGVVVGKKEEEQEKEENQSSWTAHSITIDHKPDCPKEKQRIESIGGSVVMKAGVPRVVWKRQKVIPGLFASQPTTKDSIPFLAVARSLGDLWSYCKLNDGYYVSPEPDVSVHAIDPLTTHCIVLASDGLWNAISASDAVKLVKKCSENSDKLLQGVCRDPASLLVGLALKKCALRNIKADNTSAIVVLINPPSTHSDPPSPHLPISNTTTATTTTATTATTVKAPGEILFETSDAFTDASNPPLHSSPHPLPLLSTSPSLVTRVKTLRTTSRNGSCMASFNLFGNGCDDSDDDDDVEDDSDDDVLDSGSSDDDDEQEESEYSDEMDEDEEEDGEKSKEAVSIGKVVFGTEVERLSDRVEGALPSPESCNGGGDGGGGVDVCKEDVGRCQIGVEERLAAEGGKLQEALIGDAVRALKEEGTSEGDVDDGRENAREELCVRFLSRRRTLPESLSCIDKLKEKLFPSSKSTPVSCALPQISHFMIKPSAKKTDPLSDRTDNQCLPCDCRKSSCSRKASALKLRCHDDDGALKDASGEKGAKEAVSFFIGEARESAKEDFNLLELCKAAYDDLHSYSDKPLPQQPVCFLEGRLSTSCLHRLTAEEKGFEASLDVSSSNHLSHNYTMLKSHSVVDMMRKSVHDCSDGNNLHTASLLEAETSAGRAGAFGAGVDDGRLVDGASTGGLLPTVASGEDSTPLKHHNNEGHAKRKRSPSALESPPRAKKSKTFSDFTYVHLFKSEASSNKMAQFVDESNSPVNENALNDDFRHSRVNKPHTDHTSNNTDHAIINNNDSYTSLPIISKTKEEAFNRCNSDKSLSTIASATTTPTTTSAGSLDDEDLASSSSERSCLDDKENSLLLRVEVCA